MSDWRRRVPAVKRAIEALAVGAVVVVIVCLISVADPSRRRDVAEPPPRPIISCGDACLSNLHETEDAIVDMQRKIDDLRIATEALIVSCPWKGRARMPLPRGEWAPWPALGSGSDLHD